MQTQPTQPTQPTLREANDRVFYLAANWQKVDAGNFEYGSVTYVVNHLYADKFFIAAADSGAFSSRMPKTFGTLRAWLHLLPTHLRIYGYDLDELLRRWYGGGKRLDINLLYFEIEWSGNCWLPESLLYVLENYGAERFAEAFLGNVDTPEVIWKFEMRRHLVDMIGQHIGDLQLQLAENCRVEWDFCPVPPIKYEALEEELWCHNFYLKNLTDEVRFPDWEIAEPVELMRATLDAWRLETEKEGPEISTADARKTLNLPLGDDFPTPEEVRKAYRKLALKWHPMLKTRQGGAQFGQIRPQAAPSVADSGPGQLQASAILGQSAAGAPVGRPSGPCFQHRYHPDKQSDSDSAASLAPEEKEDPETDEKVPKYFTRKVTLSKYLCLQGDARRSFLTYLETVVENLSKRRVRASQIATDFFLDVLGRAQMPVDDFFKDMMICGKRGEGKKWWNELFSEYDPHSVGRRRAAPTASVQTLLDLKTRQPGRYHALPPLPTASSPIVASLAQELNVNFRNHLTENFKDRQMARYTVFLLRTDGISDNNVKTILRYLVRRVNGKVNAVFDDAATTAFNALNDEAKQNLDRFVDTERQALGMCDLKPSR